MDIQNLSISKLFFKDIYGTLLEKIKQYINYINRFSFDECRIKKQLQESSGPGKYMLNVPGPGQKLDFFDDPHIRMQQWGGNLRTNFFDLERELQKPSGNFRDCIKQQENLVVSIVKECNKNK